jgi:hypothetical protein
MPGSRRTNLALAAVYGQLGDTDAGAAVRGLLELRPDFPLVAVGPPACRTPDRWSRKGGDGNCSGALKSEPAEKPLTPTSAELRGFAERNTAAWCGNPSSVATFCSPKGSLTIHARLRRGAGKPSLRLCMGSGPRFQTGKCFRSSRCASVDDRRGRSPSRNRAAISTPPSTSASPGAMKCSRNAGAQ